MMRGGYKGYRGERKMVCLSFELYNPPIKLIAIIT